MENYESMYFGLYEKLNDIIDQLKEIQELTKAVIEREEENE